MTKLITTNLSRHLAKGRVSHTVDVRKPIVRSEELETGVGRPREEDDVNWESWRFREGHRGTGVEQRE